MFALKHVYLKKRRTDQPLIDDLSFAVNEGEKVAIIGSEGTGKSTLLKWLLNRELDYVIGKGEVYMERLVSYVEQDITYLYNQETVEDFFYPSSLDRRYDLDVRKLCREFSFEYDLILPRTIQTLSGGEKVKVSLIRALMKTPDILLFDEPSNDLDFETVLFLENFMRKTDIPILFISHDQRLLSNVANKIVHLEHVRKGTLAKSYVYKGGYEAYKEMFERKFQSDLMIAKKERANHQKKVAKFRKIYQVVEHQQNQAVRNPSLARLLKKKMKSMKSQERRFEQEEENFKEIPEKEEPMNIFFEDKKKVNKSKEFLRINYKTFTLANGRVLRNIKLDLKGTKKLVIYGKNGIGKTTLLKSLKDVLEEKGISVGYIPQDYGDILDYSVDVVSFLVKEQAKYPLYRIRQILGQLGFKREDMLKKIEEISEGQKLKVLLLRLVSLDTEILLLDEPTRNISPLNQDEIYELFKQYQGAILAVTHDRAFIEYVFDEMMELREDGFMKE